MRRNRKLTIFCITENGPQCILVERGPLKENTKMKTKKNIDDDRKMLNMIDNKNINIITIININNNNDNSNYNMTTRGRSSQQL